jgi:hypothetical protein
MTRRPITFLTDLVRARTRVGSAGLAGDRHLRQKCRLDHTGLRR